MTKEVEKRYLVNPKIVDWGKLKKGKNEYKSYKRFTRRAELKKLLNNTINPHLYVLEITGKELERRFGYNGGDISYDVKNNVLLKIN